MATAELVAYNAGRRAVGLGYRAWAHTAGPSTPLPFLLTLREKAAQLRLGRERFYAWVRRGADSVTP